MAAVPSIGRASRVERGTAAREAEATHALYERYSGPIFGFCLHQLGSREEAEDAVQVTFLNAFRGLRRGVVPQVESAWLFKIAHNVCRSRRRSTWRRGRVESPEDFQRMQDVLPAPARVSVDLVGLQEVLERMPENQRRAILLREWQGLSYREIAGELHLSQSAVETLIFRARRSLADGLERPVEPRRLRRAARRGLDAGSLAVAAKTLLTGGSAVVALAAAPALLHGGGRQRHAPVARIADEPRTVARVPLKQASTTPATTVRAATPARPRAQVSPRVRRVARQVSTPAPTAVRASPPAAPAPDRPVAAAAPTTTLAPPPAVHGRSAPPAHENRTKVPKPRPERAQAAPGAPARTRPAAAAEPQATPPRQAASPGSLGRGRADGK